MINWINEKANLEKMILEEGKSYEEIGRIYGCSGSNIKKQSLRLGIKLNPRRLINPKETFGKGVSKVQKNFCLNCGKELNNNRSKFCSSECSIKYKHEKRYQDFLNNPDIYSKTNYSPKAFKKDILKEQGGVCDICGQPAEWNGKPLTLVLDHINGHCADNRRENIRLICPNCDSQLDTFKRRNKISDRHSIRYPDKKKIKEKERPQETGGSEDPLNDES